MDKVDMDKVDMDKVDRVKVDMGKVDMTENTFQSNITVTTCVESNNDITAAS